MYKVYLSPSTQEKSFGNCDFGVEKFRMNQIADIVQQFLLQNGDYAVFRNVSEMNKEEIINDSNEIKPNIHVAIQSNYENNPGPEVYIKFGDEISNGFGKEIYKEIIRTYHDKSIDKGLIYDEKVTEINKVNSPSILIMVGSRKNEKDSQWIVANIENIGRAIANGIIKGFALKVC